MRVRGKLSSVVRACARAMFCAEGLESRLLFQTGSVEVAGLHPDLFEPNNTLATASHLGVTGSRTVQDLSLSVPAPDNDYYRLFTPNVGPLTVSLSFLHSQGDVDMQLLNAAGTVLTSSLGVGNSENVGWPAGRNEVYYLRVFGAGSSTANPNYQMTITGPAIPADRFEPNDGPQFATDLRLSTDRTESDLTLHPSGNEDWYRLTAGGTGTLSVSLAFSQALGDVELQLQDAFGTVLATSAGTGNSESVSASVTRLGTYYVRVFGYQGATNPDYDLTIDGPDIAPDAYEPNDTFATGRDFGAIGSRTVNRLSIHAPGNEDFFRFTAGRSGPLTATVSFTHALGDVDMQLLDSSGTALTSSGGISNTETINYPLLAGQNYTLRVYGHSGAVNPEYAMVITGPAPLLDRFELNNDFAFATNLGTTADRTVNQLTFHTLQDRDYFRMTPPSSGVLSVNAASSTTAGALAVYLYDGFGNPLTIGLGAVSGAVVGGQVYYVQVLADNFTVDLYDLTVNGPDIPPDRFEPNDTFATARFVGPMGSRVDFDLSIHAPGNDDFFRFTAGVLGANPLTASIAFTHDRGDLDMQLLDSTGAVLATSNSQDNFEAINTFVVGGQTYYLRIYGVSIYSRDIGPAMNGRYDLTINGPNFPPDRFEPNYPISAAANLGTVGDLTVTNLNLHDRTDIDYFRMTVPADGVLQAAAGPSTSGVLQVFLRDAFGTFLAGGPGGASAPVVGGQVYYVQVHANGYTVQSYDLTLHGPAVPPDRFEPNDTRAAATALGPMGSRTVWDLSLHAPFNDDYFRFTGGMPGLHPLSASITFSRALGGIDLQLLDANGAVLVTASTNTDSETINTSVVGGQTYYLRVYGFDEVNPHYDLTVTGPNFPPDRFEPNDTLAFATNLGVAGDRVATQLSLHHRQDQDYFRMTPPAGGVLQVSAVSSTTPSRFFVFLRDAFGTQIATGFNTASVPVNGGQVYYVQIFTDGYTVDSYDLIIDGPDLPADRFEPNNTRAAATELGLAGDRFETNLSLHALSNDDYYRITATAAGTLSVTLIFDHAQGDVDMQLQDPAGAVLAASNSTNHSEVITRGVIAGETIYVRVYGHLGAISPNYTMSIDGPELRGTAVVGRHVFYNRSDFDRNDPAANAFDDNAIAWDKAALLPGRGAGLINLSNYSRGINGLMIDLAGRRTGEAPTADDLVLDVGNGTGWSRAPRLGAFLVRPGAGTGGSDRVSIVFEDNAVKNTWLRATVLANGRTGLAAPDVFYIANLAGDTGDSGRPVVNVTDVARTRAAVGATDAVRLSRHDFNRDGAINAADVLIARNNQRHALPLFTAPAAVAAAREMAFGDTPVPAASERVLGRPNRRGVFDAAEPGLLA